MEFENYCEDCEYQKTCEIYKDNKGDVSFCDGCKDLDECTILLSCDNCKNIQCNNGYESESVFDDDDEDEEDEEEEELL